MKKLVKINGQVSAIGWVKIVDNYHYQFSGHTLCSKYTFMQTPAFHKLLNRIPNINMACPKCRERLKKLSRSFRKNKFREVQ